MIVENLEQRMSRVVEKMVFAVTYEFSGFWLQGDSKWTREKQEMNGLRMYALSASTHVDDLATLMSSMIGDSGSSSIRMNVAVRWTHSRSRRTFRRRISQTVGRLMMPVGV